MTPVQQDAVHTVPKGRTKTGELRKMMKRSKRLQALKPKSRVDDADFGCAVAALLRYVRRLITLSSSIILSNQAAFPLTLLDWGSPDESIWSGSPTWHLTGTPGDSIAAYGGSDKLTFYQSWVTIAEDSGTGYVQYIFTNRGADHIFGVKIVVPGGPFTTQPRRRCRGHHIYAKDRLMN